MSYLELKLLKALAGGGIGAWDLNTRVATSLVRKKLVEWRQSGSIRVYLITPAGREAVAQLTKD